MGDPVPVQAPLAGVRVVTTRAASHEDRLRALLEAAGARVLAWPTCEHPPPRDPGPLDAARARLDRFDWVVFTSARAVAAMGEAGAARASGTVTDPARGAAGGKAAVPGGGRPRPVVQEGARADAARGAAGGSGGPEPGVRGSAAGAPGQPAPTPRVAVVGPATARAAAEAGWTVEVEGRGPGARGLAARVAAAIPVGRAPAMAARVAAPGPLAGARVLFPAASGAASTVEEEFAALGARVTRVEAYRTVVTPPPADRVRADLAAKVDAVTFASPSAVEAVDRALGGRPDDAATGDRIGQAAREVTDNGAAGSTAAGGGATGSAATADGTRALVRALAGIAVVCIGPTTATALADRGVRGVRVAGTATLEGMVEELVRSFRRSGAGRRDADSGHDASCAAGQSCAAVQSREAGRPDVDLGPASNTRAAAMVAGRQPGARP